MVAKVPIHPDRALLAALEPATAELHRDDVLWRVYFRNSRHPTAWNAFRFVGPVDARFDHHDGELAMLQEKGVLYAACHPATCLAEVFQKTRVIHREFQSPWLVGFALQRAVSALDLTGAFATQAGASMGLMSGPRSVSRNWARGFHGSYPDLEGLLYPSSMNGNETAIALNERALDALPAQPVFHRALEDPAIHTVLVNAARHLNYVLG